MPEHLTMRSFKVTFDNGSRPLCVTRITAAYYRVDLDSGLVEFKDTSHAVLFAVPKDRLVWVFAQDASDDATTAAQGPDLIDKLEKLQVLTLQPGDILVATIASRSLNADRAAGLKDQLEQFVPDNDVMVVSDVELAALRKAAS
jgi:hypothetical protein